MISRTDIRNTSSRASGKAARDPFAEDFDMQLARPLSRSVRLNGFATCLRLEQVYWNVLEGMAGLHQCTVNSLLSYIDREVCLRHGSVRNFTGLVRVICVVHLLSTQQLAPGARSSPEAGEATLC
jgi:predicted DNA-binding ribbon-helix-helix protein